MLEALRDDLDGAVVVALVVRRLRDEPELEGRNRELPVGGAADDDSRRVGLDGMGSASRLWVGDVDDRPLRSIDLGRPDDEARAAAENQVQLGVTARPGSGLVVRLDELVAGVRGEVSVDAETADIKLPADRLIEAARHGDGVSLGYPHHAGTVLILHEDLL